MNLDNSTVEYVYSIYVPSRKVCIKVQEDNSDIVKYIPISQNNTDYQEILEWVAAGNTITDPGA